ncbi:hypothetical protein JYT22_01040 [Endomicrobium sp. AH-315-J14]|nr:hypothetical protein [Endomicrobium sp. AH-315-J14]
MKVASSLFCVLTLVGISKPSAAFESWEHDSLAPERTASARFEYNSGYCLSPSGTLARLHKKKAKFTYGQMMAVPDWYPNLRKLRQGCVSAHITVRNKIRTGASDFWSPTTIGAQAVSNHDHFQHRAQSRWRSMHQTALKLARARRLNRALMTNAFADHFLTDAFASGHLIFGTERPDIASLRRGHRKYSPLLWKKLKKWHDEANRKGRIVHNLKGETWTAYGDGFLDKNVRHRRIIKAAVRHSVDDIYLAYAGSPVPETDGKYRAERLLPILGTAPKLPSSLPTPDFCRETCEEKLVGEDLRRCKASCQRVKKRRRDCIDTCNDKYVGGKDLKRCEAACH